MASCTSVRVAEASSCVTSARQSDSCCTKSTAVCREATSVRVSASLAAKTVLTGPSPACGLTPHARTMHLTYGLLYSHDLPRASGTATMGACVSISSAANLGM